MAAKLVEMSYQEALSTIQSALNGILDAKGVERVRVTEELPVLGGSIPIDSLDLAQIVLELQSASGKDPFEDGFIEFRTVRELADLFAQ